MMRVATLSLAGVLAMATTASAGVEDRIAERAAAGLPPDLAVASVSVPSALTGASDDATVAITWRRAVRPGTVTVFVTATEPTGTEYRGWVRFDIHAVRSVLVAARPLAAGATVSALDVAVQRRPVARGAGWAIDPVVLVGAPVIRDVAAGSVLSGADIQRPAPVDGGARLDVIVRSGAVEIKARGVLERRSELGARCAARLPGSRRLVYGRLTGRSTFVVEGGTR